MERKDNDILFPAKPFFKFFLLSFELPAESKGL
jgi:hypothetical protein